MTKTSGPLGDQTMQAQKLRVAIFCSDDGGDADDKCNEWLKRAATHWIHDIQLSHGNILVVYEPVK